MQDHFHKFRIMGDIDQDTEQENKGNKQDWGHGLGKGSWQGTSPNVRSRTSHLYNSSEMSDLSILSVDENWWFGDTVRDFSGHKFLLATASPVLNKILFDWDQEDNEKPSGDRCLVLDKRLEVTLTLSKSYCNHKLEFEGIPPIATEALLEYIYKDKFAEEDFESGYSRNLLWRLWHAARAFEMEHLSDTCVKTLTRTICEDTVFWDLNYAMKYKDLVTSDIMTKVLKMIEEMEERVFEHDNFVWLDHEAVAQILHKRKPNSCDPMIIYNNLLRWSMYQLDRNACCEVDGKTGNDIPIETRLEWIKRCRNGDFKETLNVPDLNKYLGRGLKLMPWTELSQKLFLTHVAHQNDMLDDTTLLECSLKMMEIVVENPERLLKSAHEVEKASKEIKKDEKPFVRSVKASATTNGNKITSLFSRRDSVKRVSKPTEIPEAQSEVEALGG